MYKTGEKSDGHVHHVDTYRCTAPDGVDPAAFFKPFIGTGGYDCRDVTTIPKEYCTAYNEWCFCGACLQKESEQVLNYGNGMSPNEYFMMSTHYENPEKVSNLEIDTGMRFSLKEDIKEFDSGHILIGAQVDYTHVIPAGSKSFVVPRHCAPECTDNLPHEINLISYAFHTHAAGRAVKLRHFRGGEELPEIGSLVQYDPFENQTYREVVDGRKILPGDQITLECTYDTSNLTGPSVGGASTNDEMCMAFIRYYPRVEELTQCGSSLSERELRNFVGLSGRKINSAQDMIQLAEKLDWSDELRTDYQNLVKKGNHDGYCWGSRGHVMTAKNLNNFVSS